MGNMKVYPSFTKLCIKLLPLLENITKQVKNYVWIYQGITSNPDYKPSSPFNWFQNLPHTH